MGAHKSPTLGSSLARELFTKAWVSEKLDPLQFKDENVLRAPKSTLLKFIFIFLSPPREAPALLPALSFMGHWAGRALQRCTAALAERCDVTAGWELQQPGGRASGQDQATLPTWQETPLTMCSGTPGSVLPSGTKQREQRVCLWRVAAEEMEVYTAFIFSQQRPLLMHIQSLYTKVCFLGKKSNLIGLCLFPKVPKGKYCLFRRCPAVQEHSSASRSAAQVITKKAPWEVRSGKNVIPYLFLHKFSTSVSVLQPGHLPFAPLCLQRWCWSTLACLPPAPPGMLHANICIA